MIILFFDEKMFDLDGIYNSQNDRVWAVNRDEADRRGEKKQQRKFTEQVMIWLSVCLEGVAFPALFEKDTLDHYRYIKGVLLVGLPYGNSQFGNS